MVAQNLAFAHFLPEKVQSVINRFVEETAHLYAVLDRHLAGRSFIAGDDYTIADMATYPWIVGSDRQGQSLDRSENIRRWFDSVSQRPATLRTYEMGKVYLGRQAAEKARKNA